MAKLAHYPTKGSIENLPNYFTHEGNSTNNNNIVIHVRLRYPNNFIPVLSTFRNLDGELVQFNLCEFNIFPSQEDYLKWCSNPDKIAQERCNIFLCLDLSDSKLKDNTGVTSTSNITKELKHLIEIHTSDERYPKDKIVIFNLVAISKDYLYENYTNLKASVNNIKDELNIDLNIIITDGYKRYIEDYNEKENCLINIYRQPSFTRIFADASKNSLQLHTLIKEIGTMVEYAKPKNPDDHHKAYLFDDPYKQPSVKTLGKELSSIITLKQKTVRADRIDSTIDCLVSSNLIYDYKIMSLHERLNFLINLPPYVTFCTTQRMPAFLIVDPFRGKLYPKPEFISLREKGTNKFIHISTRIAEHLLNLKREGNTLLPEHEKYISICRNALSMCVIEKILQSNNNSRLIDPREYFPSSKGKKCDEPWDNTQDDSKDFEVNDYFVLLFNEMKQNYLHSVRDFVRREDQELFVNRVPLASFKNTYISESKVQIQNQDGSIVDRVYEFFVYAPETLGISGKLCSEFDVFGFSATISENEFHNFIPSWLGRRFFEDLYKIKQNLNQSNESALQKIQQGLTMEVQELPCALPPEVILTVKYSMRKNSQFQPYDQILRFGENVIPISRNIDRPLKYDTLTEDYKFLSSILYDEVGCRSITCCGTTVIPDSVYITCGAFGGFANATSTRYQLE